MGTRAETPHLPGTAPIDAYGNGGFRFAGMSHRGSLLCLPSGIWAWPVATPADIDEAALAPLFAEPGRCEFFILGTGETPWLMPGWLRGKFRDCRLGVEVMTTGAAVRTWNIVVAEQRPVGAGLIAV
jgi:uncharacterized protein